MKAAPKLDWYFHSPDSVAADIKLFSLRVIIDWVTPSNGFNFRIHGTSYHGAAENIEQAKLDSEALVAHLMRSYNRTIKFNAKANSTQSEYWRLLPETVKANLLQLMALMFRKKITTRDVEISMQPSAAQLRDGENLSLYNAHCSASPIKVNPLGLAALFNIGDPFNCSWDLYAQLHFSASKDTILQQRVFSPEWAEIDNTPRGAALRILWLMVQGATPDLDRFKKGEYQHDFYASYNASYAVPPIYVGTDVSDLFVRPIQSEAGQTSSYIVAFPRLEPTRYITLLHEQTIIDMSVEEFLYHRHGIKLPRAAASGDK